MASPTLVGQQAVPALPAAGVIVTAEDLLQLAVIVLVISMLASLLGIWKALRVKPNEVLLA